MFGFQKLEIYQLAKEIIKYNYYLTKSFPSGENFALAQQMNRAAVSIASNIAEGTSRGTYKDQIKFIGISYGSLMEVASQCDIAYDLDYITNEQRDTIFKMIKNLSVKMTNYKTALIAKGESR